MSEMEREPAAVYVDGFTSRSSALFIWRLATLLGLAKPRPVRRLSLAKIAKLARSTGQRIVVVDRSDGSRAVEISEQADAPVEIDTPDELRRLI